MRKGCFGSLIAASETGRACLACPDRSECHQSAKEVAISMYGKFVGFPNDKIKKTRKVKTHEGSDGQN
ncbi:hypothetical protein BFI45_19770 (plasmid) [Yersinia pestis subsp. microtus bv. Altaica]|uniref:Uncharacterized protein n=6 Tax=Enterobacterales TaxID=91347 RepID=A0A709XYR8_SALTM|nr:hypothetical protein YpAngola_0107 [Yersinia pestis Angola]AYW81536.1 hypothetical protein EGX42_00220 [Yersinia pestis]EAA9732346.1 hypothetical protein [Salmonella enterica subsp. enterica]EAQ9186626.1 hypothetical protein [Salmonella enterica]EBF6577385.1 hypothetical protein [Salmonella enterica subsp. enterica serovar Typhimurium]EBM0688026.1 hypothetical protein [Salmonella enterica subsp. enterica serovar Schwarzengrund]EBR0128668.1 hypothetical protein [Salmonella enterica subsp. e